MPDTDFTKRIQSLEEQVDKLRADLRQAQNEIASMNRDIGRTRKELAEIKEDILSLAQAFSEAWEEKNKSPILRVQ